ncbi:secretory pathway Sec39 [Aspergillus steynii IBT 23096]|uniref:Secretory pathway Sec39 n=1 Tax=Aspergillus steynii IBT 23096 TaxID=1392250 RepID=A0A2I2G1R8_9EURO|nr:secretory pathway Sec39 [Aspergillus steynii IBT 23096]PLB46818.1 secretory pathway Sec39 [Aspergillus steynii IBT 23096]
MAAFAGLSAAHAILLATHWCATANLSHLPLLQARFPACLPSERLLRIILTFLPESTAPQRYTSVVQDIVDGGSNQLDTEEADISSVKDLTEAVARKRVRKLRLLPLRCPDDEDGQDSEDLLAQFLIHRAYRIDGETSLQPLILDLLLPFYERSPSVRTWLISTLLPLLRLNYEYYPSQDETFSLDTLESMDDHTAINVLLSMTGAERNVMDLVNNLRGLVGSWMYGSNRSKRRRLSQAAQQNSISSPPGETQPLTRNGVGWHYVNEWLVSRSLVDLESVVRAFSNWGGPEDVDLGGYDEGNGQLQKDEVTDLRIRYAQSGLAVIYANGDISGPSLEGSSEVLARVSRLLDYEDTSFLTSNTSALPSITFEANRISSSSRVSLLQNALLLASNPLTYPSASSVSFLGATLLSLRILNELGYPIPCRAAANICLHSHEDMQLLELRNVMASAVRQTQSGRDWRKTRQQLLWLRDWGADSMGQAEDHPNCHGLFWRVPRHIVETEVLKAMLDAKEYNLAVELYVTSSSTVNLSQVEEAVKEAIFSAYDNASNGNRTRGGMRKAHEILQAFQPHMPDSTSFKKIHALISATHSLSFYSLTLQHGVPFQPVSIRVHSDPLSLIEKVLDQNSKAYTKLDDLLSIGRNLVAAGFSPHLPDDEGTIPADSENAVVTAERRIMSLAISSALSDDDFGTAYSYILTRLTPPSLISTSSPLTNPAVKDDISWRAVYNAGRYRSQTASASPNLQFQITRLSQRMELLSLALILVPSPDPLPEVLGAWRRCDEEMTGLRTRESEEEEIWDTKGDRISMVPGGFGPTDSEQDAFETQQHHARRARAQQQQSRLNLEEAPMGLFEVARGAALALHKNAFPLRGAAETDADADPPSDPLHHSASHVRGPSDDERVRKRDVVSNMVTGGLASGIGWVLGAQPVNR